MLTDQRLLIERKGKLLNSIPYHAITAVELKWCLIGNRSQFKKSNVLISYRNSAGEPEASHKLAQLVPQAVAPRIAEYLGARIQATG